MFSITPTHERRHEQGRYGKGADSPLPVEQYFGGKSAVADMVWSRLGAVDNFIEPFFGSGAVLLARPDSPKIETVNDINCHLANFWRSVKCDPEGVVEHADWPVNEADLHSRHRWLARSETADEFRQRMCTDPDYYDVKFAGWWVWGISCWIGDGWCRERGEPGQKRPYISGGEHQYGMGIHAGRPVSCAERRAWLLNWFSRLQDRLRSVRVLCGDWSRVCSTRSATTTHGVTGVFVDPPYSSAAERHDDLYSNDSQTVALDVRRWCLEWGNNPLMRICLAGYASEGHEMLLEHGWREEVWEVHGGYGNASVKGQANKKKERLWFSPHCLYERTLFG